MDEQDPVCLGCHRSIEEGSVVAFGEGLWHVHCFRCAKCQTRVECDSNLLLLSDGSPICEQCSYSCNACWRPILDEAIMTGDEAYHAECFRCVQCECKIDDLVFAKTSQGIYCMKCHKERKEAKRQREERERMERAERMMEKLLPTIQEGEHQPSSISKSLGSPKQQNGARLGETGLSPHDMSKSPIKAAPTGSLSARDESHTQTTRTDHRPKQSSNGVASVGTGPPFLPPLAFGMDDPVSSEFDLEEMLTGSEKDEKSSTASSPGLPTTPTMGDDISNEQDRSAYRVSVSRFSSRLSTSLLNGATFGDGNGHISEITQSPPSSCAKDELETLSAAEAIALARELRMELAKHHPSNPLLHGTPQREYGLLLERTEQLTQKHAELEASMRDMYIEKDLLGMDIEAMNEELKAKENALASNGSGKLNALPAAPNPRMSTNHEFMKQAYQGEVKALQEQKERLQLEIQAFVEQRDSVLDEMQVLSVRNAELSTINNDMMREMQGRSSKSTPAATASGSMLSSFTGKMRKTRQPSGGHQEANKSGGPPVAGSGDSTLSFTSHHSDESRSQHGVASRSRRDEVQEDLFGEEQVTPKKFNWKKGTMNTMNSGVKNVGAMFGKLLVENPSHSLEVPGSRNGPMYSDNGSSNGQVLPPTSRSASSSSETRSFNGRFPEQHFFVQYNYLKPTRCECCDDKIWGREYRCRGCGFQVHGRCSHEVSSGCSGKLKDSDSSSARNITPSGGSSHGFPSSSSPSPSRPVMFGNNLLDQLELEQRAIPMVVERCIEAVDERGLEVEGIYRRSGMAAETRQLVQAYDIGLQPDLMDAVLYQDICSITGVLKQYLRSLPEPLVPYDMYGDLMEAIGMPQTESKTEAFRELLDRMPYAHYATLKTLLEHLNRVTERESINLMTPKNLSVVFGPTLMRNPDPNREILDTTYKNMTIEYLILNTSDLFVRTEKSTPTTTTTGSTLLDPPGSASSSSDASGVPAGFTGQRQGSLGSQGQLSPPPRRVAGHASGPTLPPRSSSGDGTPVMSHAQPYIPHPQHPQQHPQHHAQHQQQQHHPQQHPNYPYHPQQQQQQQSQQQQYHHQQQQQQQQFYRPQAYQPPQHQTLQQLKQQQQQREQLHREQQQQQQQQQKEQGWQSQQDEVLPATLQTSDPAISSEPTQSPPSAESSRSSSPPSVLQLVPVEPQHQHANPEVDMTHFP
ncbi:hypothetical protein BGZ67_000788 [Mortierella alpina]|nr:hypothetical protein BGZ67_000788 [Mortierella alpina]